MSDKTNALAALEPFNPRFKTGKTTRTVEFAADLTSANSDDDDQIVLASGLSLADRISGIRANSTSIPALTSATDNDLGFFYKNEEGVLKELVAGSGAILWDGVSMATAFTGQNALFAKNAALDKSKNIGDLLGLGNDQDRFRGLFLVLTMNTANTATATLDLAIDIDCATTG